MREKQRYTGRICFKWIVRINSVFCFINKIAKTLLKPPAVSVVTVESPSACVHWKVKGYYPFTKRENQIICLNPCLKSNSRTMEVRFRIRNSSHHHLFSLKHGCSTISREKEIRARMKNYYYPMFTTEFISFVNSIGM